MSKSDPSDQSRINLTDSEDQIIKNSKSKNRFFAFSGKSKSLENRPEVENLINIFLQLVKII